MTSSVLNNSTLKAARDNADAATELLNSGVISKDEHRALLSSMWELYQQDSEAAKIRSQHSAQVLAKVAGVKSINTGENHGRK